METRNFLHLIALVAAVSQLCSCRPASTDQEADLFSPDRSIRVSCGIVDSLDGSIQYAVWFHGREVVSPSGLGIELKGMPLLGKSLRLVSRQETAVDETWDRVWGKRKKVTNRYNQVKLEMREKVPPKRMINLYLRAYDDGIALRYEIPVQKGLDTLVIADERFGFRFPADHTVWATFWNTFRLSQEVEFSRSKLSNIRPDHIIGTPLLVQAGDSTWVALMEANVTDWACSGLTADPDHKNALLSRPSPLPGDSTVAVRTANQRFSPWKVVMIADRPGGLVESDILQNLNEPCAIPDVSWIRPGISAWDWWWCGSYAPSAGFRLGPNTRTMKYFIDFAAEMGWQYQLVDWQWYGPPFSPDGSFNTKADITRMNPDINIPEIVQYAAKKKIKTILWILWANADRQMEEAFAQYEKWGVAGVKIDFMDRNDQEMVDFYHRVARTAAMHHLVVDFHGAYVPDGLSRTWPNLITREGVLGNEYNKWSARVTPVHCLTLPFTRMLAGEMDFTPGGFLNDTPEQFRIVGSDNPAPHVMGTRCFQLAMLVVYESAFGVFCDSPDNVRNQPGSDFLKGIPASWDETRVLEGFPGEYIAIARRSGDTWYVAGMSTGARTFTIRCDFLGERNYRATTWCDAPDSDRHPRKLVRGDMPLNGKGDLVLKVAPAGGFTAILKPSGS